MATGNLVSRTRRIESLPLHLLKRGQLHILPVYYLARLSRLGRELVSNQGSAEYQDLVYLNQPQGKLLIGKIFDRYLLNFPTARGCRSRLAATEETVEQLVAARNASNVVILDLGCGYARGLIALTESINSRRNGQFAVYGMDLNQRAVETAAAKAKEKGLTNMAFSSGDALNPGDYPVRSADIVVLTGLAQYLPRDERMLLYRNVHAVLNEDGFLLTDYFCNWARNPIQKWWKGIGERFLGARLDWLNKDEVEAMFSELPFRNCRTWYSHDRLCLMILAQK